MCILMFIPLVLIAAAEEWLTSPKHHDTHTNQKKGVKHYEY